MCPPSAWINFLTRVTTDLRTLRSAAPLLMHLAALRIRWFSSLVFTLFEPRRWTNVTNHMGFRINPTAQFQPATHVCRFKMLNALDRVPSVCNVLQTLIVEVSTSGLNFRANSESKMSYCIRTHGSNLQRLLSLEQLKCSGSFYPWWSQQYRKLPFMG